MFTCCQRLFVLVHIANLSIRGLNAYTLWILFPSQDSFYHQTSQSLLCSMNLTFLVMAIRKADGKAFLIGSGIDEVIDTVGKIEHDRQNMTIPSITLYHMVGEMVYQSGCARLSCRS